MFWSKDVLGCTLHDADRESVLSSNWKVDKFVLEILQAKLLQAKLLQAKL